MAETQSLDIRFAREAIPSAMVGKHRVPFLKLPERFSAYVSGAGTLVPRSTVERPEFDYYAEFEDLVGFLDIYRDAANETLYVGYINVRSDFRRRGIAWSLVRVMLDAYPQTVALNWGLLQHPAVQHIYLVQYREGVLRVTGSRRPDPGSRFVHGSTV